MRRVRKTEAEARVAVLFLHSRLHLRRDSAEKKEQEQHRTNTVTMRPVMISSFASGRTVSSRPPWRTARRKTRRFPFLLLFERRLQPFILPSQPANSPEGVEVTSFDFFSISFATRISASAETPGGPFQSVAQVLTFRRNLAMPQPSQERRSSPAYRSQTPRQHLRPRLHPRAPAPAEAPVPPTGRKLPLLPRRSRAAFAKQFLEPRSIFESVCPEEASAEAFRRRRDGEIGLET